jgi:hypothetical protein
MKCRTLIKMKGNAETVIKMEVNAKKPHENKGDARTIMKMRVYKKPS